MDFILFVLRVSLMAIPLYLCNGLALVFGGKTPVDFGKRFFDGKPLLGGGKTVKGTFSGIFLAFLVVLALSTVFPETENVLGASYLFYGSLLAAGAVAGDFAGSFLKRRLGIARGKSVFLLDQLDFVLGGFALGLLLVVPHFLEVIFLLGFTMIWHVIGNHIAFFARIKKEPW
jgi:CDP-2,3-bis-(O-geranylgeranyl)-sn-glycerol synthase